VHVEQRLLQRAWRQHGQLHHRHALLILCTELASSYTLRWQRKRVTDSSSSSAPTQQPVSMWLEDDILAAVCCADWQAAAASAACMCTAKTQRTLAEHLDFLNTCAEVWWSANSRNSTNKHCSCQSR
jgi:hypothetical protein